MSDHDANGHSDLVNKSRNRIKPKATSKPEAEKMKVTVYLDADLAKRFIVHSTMVGVDRSTLFAEMVKKHCGRYVVSDRGAKSDDKPLD